MKTLSKILAAVWFLGAVDANAELKRFLLRFPQQNGGKTISGFEVKADEIIIVKSNSLNNIFAVVDHGDGFIVEYNLPKIGTAQYKQVEYPVIVGPAEIKFKMAYSGPTINAVFTYDLQKTTTSSSSPSLPSNTVVIPTDASGPVEIVMESSKDLVNWTRAEPGTYGADTPKRFFRIRAVVKP